MYRLYVSKVVTLIVMSYVILNALACTCIHSSYFFHISFFLGYKMYVNYEVERQRHNKQINYTTNYVYNIYVHTDDISEERLRVLWLEAHPPTVDAPDSVDVSQDQTHVEATQETVPTNSGERGEGRVVDGEGGEGGAGGSGEEGQVLDGAVENKSQEEEGGEEGGEGGDAVEEDRVGEEGENEVKGEVKVKGEEGKAEEGEEEGGAGGEKVQENGELVDQTADHMAGFGEDPFVQAAAKFSRYELTGILELLTQAINTGE